MWAKRMSLWAALAACVVLAGAAGPRPALQTSVKAGPSPWTHARVDDRPQDFAFAVVSDLESGYRPGVFEVAAAELALLRPAFILTTGDLIEGGTEDAALLNKEWDAFDARLAQTPAPFVHLPGNHDMTNLAQRKVWAERYGPRYSWFVYKDVLFLLLDTEDYSEAEMQQIYRERAEYLALRKSDPQAAKTAPYTKRQESFSGQVSAAQSAFFEKAIASHPKVRWTILLMHKPVYLRKDEPGLARIEAALKGRPYTLLNGHLHRYAYSTRNGRDYIMLGTTGGERGFDGSAGAFDHMMWITMTKDGPSIANLKLDGVLDKTGQVPADGAKLCLGWGAPPCPPAPAKP